jgi:hypothetical protein
MRESDLLVESPPRATNAAGSSSPTPPLSSPPTASPRHRPWLRLALLVVLLAAGYLVARRTVLAPEPPWARS